MTIDLRSRRLAALFVALAATATASAGVSCYEYMTITGRAAQVPDSGVYVNTGYVPNYNTIVRAKFSVSDNANSSSNNQLLFCSRKDTTAAGLYFSFFCNAGGNMRWDYYNTNYPKTGVIKDADYELEVKDGKAKISWNSNGSMTSTTVGSGALPSFSPLYPIVLFQSYSINSSGNPSGFYNAFHGRFYYLQIYEIENGKEVLKRDFRPCVEDGEVKLCDLANAKTTYPLTVTGNGVADVTGATELSLLAVKDTSLVRNANGSYTLGAKSAEAASEMSWIRDDGTTVTTNDAQNVGEDGTAIWTIPAPAAGKTYRISVYAKNEVGFDEAEAGTLYTGDLSIGATVDAQEYQQVPGTVAVSRVSADPWPLVLNYTVASAAPGASQGTTWMAPEPVVIPANSATGYLLVTPIMDLTITDDVLVTVTLVEGNYALPPTTTASLYIRNYTADANANMWIAMSDGLASNPDNWSAGRAPLPTDNVIFDGGISSANCEWDAAATHSVASWQQTASYTGTVTFCTKYPVTADPFQTFTVTGACEVNGGTWTHPVSVNMDGSTEVPTVAQLRAAYTYRLNVAAGSFTLGPGATIDAVGKGHRQYKTATGGGVALYPAHGGRSAAASVPCYGNPKYPEDIGYASNYDSVNQNRCSAGGGAVKLSVSGACVVNGTITVNGSRDEATYAAGAAGSVLIEADSISGSGSILAEGTYIGYQYRGQGVGGRIALIARTLEDASALNVHAGCAVSTANVAAAAGTVYLKDSSMTDGVLVVREKNHITSSAARLRRTDVTDEGEWKFDRLVFQGNVQLAVLPGRTLTLPGWNKIDASANTVVASGLYYYGGTLDFGDEPDVTLSGKWYFAPVSNYVFNANVTLAGSMYIGFGGSFEQSIDSKVYPDGAEAINCTVAGNLTVPAGCTLSVYGSGPLQTPAGRNDDCWIGAHGGRWSSDNLTFDSVFSPHLPGISKAEAGRYKAAGLLRLVVGGTLNLGGSVVATGASSNIINNDESGLVRNSAGSINITAGRLVGAGSIQAKANMGGQPGGRIAIRLTDQDATFDGFTGTINAATVQTNGYGSCGSIYLQTAAEGEKCGRIVFDGFDQESEVSTPICATGYAADPVADFAKANVVVRNKAKVQVAVADERGQFFVNSLDLAEGCKLDLCGRRLCVKAVRLNGVRLSSGKYAAGDKAVSAYVVDTGTGGMLRVGESGLFIQLR